MTVAKITNVILVGNHFHKLDILENTSKIFIKATKITFQVFNLLEPQIIEKVNIYPRLLPWPIAACANFWRAASCWFPLKKFMFRIQHAISCLRWLCFPFTDLHLLTLVRMEAKKKSVVKMSKMYARKYTTRCKNSPKWILIFVD